MFRSGIRAAVLLSIFVLSPVIGFSAPAPTSIRLLYPSFAGSWATAWIAKEAGYFLDEGLDVELIRVGGSTRMVAAMLGGSAPIIQAGAVAALAATAAGSDVVIIGATGTVSPFRLMARWVRFIASARWHRGSKPATAGPSGTLRRRKASPSSMSCVRKCAQSWPNSSHRKG